MTTNTGRHGASRFDALELAIECIGSLRGLVQVVRRQDAKLARQIVAAASSVAANIAEGNRRRGADRLHFFRIAAGSADETRTHLRHGLGMAVGRLDQAGAGAARPGERSALAADALTGSADRQAS